MKLKFHFLVAPIAAFGIILLWAAIFGNTLGEEKTMIEEWFVSMPIYLAIVFFLNNRKNKFTNDE